MIGDNDILYPALPHFFWYSRESNRGLTLFSALQESLPVI
jgi:hypothetical protein